MGRTVVTRRAVDHLRVERRRCAAGLESVRAGRHRTGADLGSRADAARLLLAGRAMDLRAAEPSQSLSPSCGGGTAPARDELSRVGSLPRGADDLTSRKI